MQYDAKITSDELTRIHEKLPEGYRINRLTTTTCVDFMGMTFYVHEGNSSRVSISRMYYYTRVWEVRGLNGSVRVMTDDYDSYLKDMSILRLI
jgi:hypothetical protein